MKIDRLLAILSASAVLTGVAAGSVTHASAHSYPSQVVRLVVPYSAGGGSDAVARIVAAKLAETLGQSVVVDNRAGAGGNIGTRFVAEADPDGYTLGLATPGPITVGKSLYTSLPYDPETAFEPVVLLNESPIVMAASAKLPVKDLASLKAWANAQKSELDAAIAGTGSVNHLTTELFKQASGIPVFNVPYKGGSEALTDTIAGHVEILFAPLSAASSAIAAGQLVPILIAAPERSPLLPQVPSAVELALPTVVASAWNGIVVPKGTPSEIVSKLNDALNEVLQQRDVQEAFAKQGMTAMGGTPQEFQHFLREDTQKWQQVIEQAEIEKL